MDAEALMKARWIRDAQRQLLREQEARRQRLFEDCLWRHRWGEVCQRPAPGAPGMEFVRSTPTPSPSRLSGENRP